MHIEVVCGAADSLPGEMMVGAHLTSWLRECDPKSRVCAAIKRSGNSSVLIDCFGREDYKPRDDLFPYHAWHGEQETVDFWQSVHSWTLYWRAVQHGESGDPCWMDAIAEPLPTTPLLSFLSVSGGRFLWGYQLELAYRLIEAAADRASGFRKQWNACVPSAIEEAGRLRLPDGSTLLETIEARLPPGPRFDSTLGNVPAHVVQHLLKPPQFGPVTAGASPVVA